MPLYSKTENWMENFGCWIAASAIRYQMKRSNYEHTISGVLNSGFEIHFNAEFSFNPNQTHLNKLIFKITNKLQAGDFDQGWS